MIRIKYLKGPARTKINDFFFNEIYSSVLMYSLLKYIYYITSLRSCSKLLLKIKKVMEKLQTCCMVSETPVPYQSPISS